jgi:hypothetical protein
VAVGLDDPLRLDEFLETIAPDAGDGLALSIGPWHIDLVATAVRTSVLTALVAASSSRTDLATSLWERSNCAPVRSGKCPRVRVTVGEAPARK